MPRLVIAFVTFGVAVGLADLGGWGHGCARLLLVELLFLIGAFRLTERGWSVVWAGLAWASMGVTLLALCQLAVMPRPVGPFRSANFLGSFAALMVCIGLWRRANLAIAANFLSVVLSQSRGALLALVAAGMIFCWRKGINKSPIYLSVLTMLIAVGWLTWSRGVGDPRFGIWYIALRAGLRHPWLGWGEGGLLIGFNGLVSYYNIALEWFVNAGLIGLAAGVWLYAEALIAARGEPALLAFLAAFAVQGMFMFGMAATYLPLVIVLAALANAEFRAREHPSRDVPAAGRGAERAAKSRAGAI